jgi:hypothetical protein
MLERPIHASDSSSELRMAKTEMLLGAIFSHVTNLILHCPVPSLSFLALILSRLGALVELIYESLFFKFQSPSTFFCMT